MARLLHEWGLKLAIGFRILTLNPHGRSLAKEGAQKEKEEIEGEGEREKKRKREIERAGKCVCACVVWAVIIGWQPGIGRPAVGLAMIV